MRMLLQEAGSAAMACALSSATQVRGNNSFFMDERSLGCFYSTTLRSENAFNTNCGDRQLHWGDGETAIGGKPPPTFDWVHKSKGGRGLAPDSYSSSPAIHR
ncbi:hypothetical protein cym2001_05420 [Pseudomonas sp. CYM-20-01]|nr:hypothetical protein cym2001_05420 [Pseudomonas sp. CYM-20-01]